MEKSFKLMVQYATNSTDVPTRPQFRRWVKAALTQEAEIVLRIVDEAEGCELNHQFRNKDYATNVLTFVYDDTQPLTGDIVLCAPVVSKEAGQQHKNLIAHYAHLTVHGVLHLQGYDHIEEAEAVVMEQMETQILARLGYDDPYTEHGDAISPQ
ncbi:MAG: rRNA maturation RNase YbeY [Nitrosomonas sp.]|uniref:rRNA maturation RNase YbeY n=1 Tax=Nitrosomonas sp. TaxID=42353 RepID=UPI002734C69B|nr:rRNA maturation RNase YbeY [Nitrosomonas sp.]MDP3280253.1 rRNA maturation RNase YbeY [Nitrosomonas sp.]MDP3663410.1 rRNA maturation RNase YbeY [Nitrosomonas sp.]MDZ4105748.1 rRNA maturation RNase YbeY [Nitrosomonas sp.]